MAETDREIKAMQKVGEALEPLDQQTAARVLEWAQKKFNRPASASAGTATGSYASFIELFEAVNPDNEAARVLVGAYWLQVVNGEDSFGGTQVNELLKQEGHDVVNIKKTMGHLENRNPAQVDKVSNSGIDSGRNAFKLTTAGIEAIEEALRVPARI